MNLSDLLNNNQIEKIACQLSDVKNRRNKAYRIFNFSKKSLVGLGAGDEDIIYTNLYNAVRISCEAILLLYGYRAKKSSEGHHYLVINAASELMNKELENEFSRIQKMRQKRNRFDYGDLTGISQAELQQAIDDAGALLKKIDELIKNKENQLGI